MLTTNQIHVETLPVGAAGYPMLSLAFNALDNLDGVTLSVTSTALELATTTVNVVAIHTGKEDIAAAIGANDYYSVNAGAATKHLLGTLTFDFTTHRENVVQFKPGTVIGALTFPTVMPQRLALVFASSTLRIQEAIMSRRNHPSAI